MLLWRIESKSENEDRRVECHLVRRDMEYRLSVRRGKTLFVNEVHRTMVSASERAEELRRQALEGALWR